MSNKVQGLLVFSILKGTVQIHSCYDIPTCKYHRIEQDLDRLDHLTPIPGQARFTGLAYIFIAFQYLSLYPAMLQ